MKVNLSCYQKGHNRPFTSVFAKVEFDAVLQLLSFLERFMIHAGRKLQ